MMQRRWFQRIPLGDAGAAVLLVALCIYCGLGELASWRGPAYTLTNELYVPAAMFALGEGFINPPVEEVPGLRAFLYPETGKELLAPEALPEQYSSTDWSTYQQYHRYLVYTMGIVWRLFGISWDSAKVVAIGFYAAVVLLVYALIRLACGRVMGLATAALVAVFPVTLALIYNIRDFSKGPFLLAIIGGLIYLILEPRARRQLLIAAALLGVVAGIGMGFRRDLMIAIPPVAAVLLLVPLATGRRSLRLRTGALACFGLACMLTAGPVLSAFNQRGTLAWHDIMMGFSDVLEDELGITDASYERMPVKHDVFVTGLALGNARRETSSEMPLTIIEHDEAKRKYVLKTLYLFPADMVLRAEASVLRVLQGIIQHGQGWRYGWSVHMERWGFLYAMAGFIAISAVRFRLALGLFLLLLYFGGITSMQFEWRHAYHLFFAPVFFLLFPWYALWQVARTARQGIVLAALRPMAARVGAFAGIAAGILLLPWLLGLGWQSWQMRGIERALDAAPVMALETRQVAFGGWVYFQPRQPIPDVLPAPEREHPHFNPLYLMVELETYPGHTPLDLIVQSEDGWHDYSAFVKVSPIADSTGNRLRYFFHVPEERGAYSCSRFEAVGLPEAYAHHLRGIFLVTYPGVIGTNTNFSLVDNPALRRHYQTLRSPFDISPRHVLPVEGDPTLRTRINAIHGLIRQARYSEAEPLLDEALGWGLCRLELTLAKAKVLGAKGAYGEARSMFLEAMRDWPWEVALAYAYEKWLQAHPEVDALSAWEAAAEMAPGNPVVMRRVSRARELARHASP